MKFQRTWKICVCKTFLCECMCRPTNVCAIPRKKFETIYNKPEMGGILNLYCITYEETKIHRCSNISSILYSLQIFQIFSNNHFFAAQSWYQHFCTFTCHMSLYCVCWRSLSSDKKNVPNSQETIISIYTPPSCIDSLDWFFHFLKRTCFEYVLEFVWWE